MPYLGRRSTTGGKPPFVLKLSGQRPAGVAFLPWLLVFMALVPHWCCFLGVVVVPPCAACRASTKSYGRRPSIYREGEPTEGWGNPEGVPRPQAALRRFVLLRRSSYPRFSAFQLQAIFIGKKKLEAPYRFRGGAISREKGVRFHVDNRPRGGAISRTGGVRFHVEKLAYPQGFSTDRACSAGAW